MPRFVNEYSPQTGIGQGLNNAVGALFSGKGPRDLALDGAHMDAYRASADSSRAHAAKLQAEADSERAGLGARQNFLEDALKLIPGVGAVGLPGAHSYLDSGATPQEAITSPDEAGPLGHQDAPWFTPTVQRNIDTTAQLASLLMAAKPSNIDQLAQARTRLAGGVDQAGVLAGNVSPTAFAQSRGKPVVNIKDGYLYNPQDGNVDPTELGIATALIGQRDSSAAQHDAAAELDWERMNTEKARQGNLRASAKRQGASTKLVPVTDENGDTIWMPAGEASGEKVGAKPGVPKEPQKKALNKSQQDVVAGAVASHEADLNAQLDAQTKARIVSRATQLATDPKSEFYQDPAGATETAFGEVGELDVSGRWNPFSKNTATAKNKPVVSPPGGGYPSAPAKRQSGATKDYSSDREVPAVKGVPNSGAAPIAARPLPAAAAPAGEVKAPVAESDDSLGRNAAEYARAQGEAARAGKDAQLLDEAVRAIEQGADIGKVNQRLRDMGYSGEPIR